MRPTTRGAAPGCATSRMFATIQANQLALLQLMTNDLRDLFATGLDPTKCLNTAVLVMFLTSGRKGVEKAFYCNVSNVTDRYASVFSADVLTDYHLRRIFAGLLAPSRRAAGGTLHYIMLTNTTMPSPSPSPSPSRPATTQKAAASRMFPGHVFVIERVASPGEDTSQPRKGTAAWRLHQSYINAYEMESNDRGAPWVEHFCTEIAHFAKARTWDDRCASFWRFLTHVDGTSFVGFDKSSILLCHQMLSTCKSRARFTRYVGGKLAELGPGLDDSVVFGDERLYSTGVAKGVRPLTVGEMRQSLVEILAAL